MTQEQLSKLPKWAQEEFKKMSYSITKMGDEIKTLRNENAESRIMFYPSFDGDAIYIPTKNTIRFMTNPKTKQYIDVELDNYDLKNDADNVGLTIRGSECLSMECSYANQLTVRNR